MRKNPVTSADAWEVALRKGATVRDRVLAILATHGPVTLDELVRQYVRYRGLYDWTPASESGIRSRCAELAHAGLVEAVPHERLMSRLGHPAKLWRAVIV